MKSLKSGIVIATAAAALFSTGLLISPTVQAADGAVKCAGINSCKGTSECKTAKNECKGQNGCKGLGWTHSKSAKVCADAGGTVSK